MVSVAAPALSMGFFANSGQYLCQSFGRRDCKVTAPFVILTMSWQRSAGTLRRSVFHSWTVGGETPNRRANAPSPPTMLEAISMGFVLSIPPLLGITDILGKALPNSFVNSPIHNMNSTEHLGTKLKEEARRLGIKPVQVAEFFGVKAPSVYDWYEHGRIHKRHYAKLVEFSGKPLYWWLNFPVTALGVTESASLQWPSGNAKHQRVLELFESLPTQEQEELLDSLAKKKEHYDAVVEEMLLRRFAVERDRNLSHS
jgi:hypothetical protein